MENKPDFVSRVVMFLSDTNRLMRSVESILIDLFAATAPWLAPVLPAYMVWDSLTHRMTMPSWVSMVGALVIEFLGLSAISTTLTLWTYNDHKRESAASTKVVKSKRRKPHKIRGLAPVWVAAGAGGFYLVVVLVVNVLLDDAQPKELIAKALLSSLSIIAGLILAVRGQHARRLEDAEARKERMRLLRSAATLRRQMSHDVASVPDMSATMPTFNRGYEGFVEYLSYLRDSGATFDKTRAAVDLGYSVRQIERFVETGKGNGTARLFAEVSRK